VIALEDEPDVRLVELARPRGLSACTASSRNQYSPVQEASSIPMMDRSVDLPAPDGPMIVTNSPSWMSRSIRRRTNVRPAEVS
jgi:hypothetical protein